WGRRGGLSEDLFGHAIDLSIREGLAHGAPVTLQEDCVAAHPAENGRHLVHGVERFDLVEDRFTSGEMSSMLGTATTGLRPDGANSSGRRRPSRTPLSACGGPAT